jgi:hypothetical protein
LGGLLRLVGDVRRLAYDRSLDDADRAAASGTGSACSTAASTTTSERGRVVLIDGGR